MFSEGIEVADEVELLEDNDRVCFRQEGLLSAHTKNLQLVAVLEQE